MTDETYTLCPTCEQRVDPNEAGVIYAVEILRLDTMTGRQYSEGMGAFFHADHFPVGSPRWREKPKP